MEYSTFDDENAAFHRFLVFGDTGTGKTGCLVRALADLDLEMDSDAVLDGDTAPKGDAGIFLLATEANGLQTARAFNPLLRYRLCDTKRSVQEVLRAAGSGELAQDGIHTLAVDGGTEIQRLIKDAQIGDDLANAAQDKLDYSLYNESTRKLLRVCRNIPLNVVMSALVRTKGNEESDEMELWPSFEGGKLPGEAAQYFSAVGYATKTNVGNGVYRHVVHFSDLPPRFKVKSAGRISKALKPCAQAWMAVADGRLDRRAVRLIVPSAAEIEAQAAAAKAAAAEAKAAAVAGAAAPGRPGRSKRASSAETPEEMNS